MIQWLEGSDNGEQYPAAGASERGRTVRVPRWRGGKALPCAGRKWPAGPRRYRVKSARRTGANSGGTADSQQFALSHHGSGRLFLRFEPEIIEKER